MPVHSLRRLGVVGLLAATLALPTSAAIASTTVDTPDQPSAQAREYLGSASGGRIARAADAEPETTPDITKLSFASSATYGPEGAYVEGRAYATGNVARAKTEVRVNGVYKGLVEIYYNPDRNKEYVVYKSGWGAGKVVLGPSYITQSADEEPTKESLKDTTKSGELRVRYGLHPSAYFTAGRSGNKVSLKAVRFTMFKIHKYVSMGRTIVQVKTSSGWKDKKVLKLAGNGNSVTYTFKVSGKKYYRFKVTTTDERQGFVSEVYHG